MIPSYAANGVQTAKMCDAFAQTGHRVILISSDHGASAPSDDTADFYGLSAPLPQRRVAWPKWGAATGYRFAIRAVRMVRRAGPDLVYTRSTRVAFASALLGVRTILELHTMDPVRRQDDALVFRALCRLPSLRHIVTISHALRRDLEAGFPCAVGRCIVAHDAATPPKPDVLPLDLGRRPGQPIVGYVGGLYPGKALEIIQACAQRLPEFRFHVAGHVEAEGVAGRIGGNAHPNLHLHGFLPPSQTDAFRAACDILVAPYQSRVETFGGGGDVARWMSPLKLFEYMAAQRPIVCSDLPVLREVLTHRVNALLCPPDDVDAWSQALIELHEDERLAGELAKSAFATFSQQHTYAARAEAVLGHPGRPDRDLPRS